MRAIITEIRGNDYADLWGPGQRAALDIDGVPAGIIDLEFDGDDIDNDNSGRTDGGGGDDGSEGIFYDLDAVLVEAGVQRMVDGDYAQNWREIESGLWTVELTDAL